jgi:hypothetical protein
VRRALRLGNHAPWARTRPSRRPSTRGGASRSTAGSATCCSAWSSISSSAPGPRRDSSSTRRTLRPSRARRARVECAFAILDDIGWHTEDPRESFHVTVRDADVLGAALLQWRDWQIQALEDIRRDRVAGVPVSRTAPELLRAAERMAVLAALLSQLR